MSTLPLPAHAALAVVLVASVLLLVVPTVALGGLAAGVVADLVLRSGVVDR